MNHARTIALALSIALLTPLTGCAEKPVTSGTVTSKEHDAAGVKCKTKNVNGKTKRTCKYEPEEWEIDLKSGYRTGEVKVDKATWDTYRVGDRYPR